MDMVADITVSGWTSCKTLCVILFSSLRGTLVHEDNVLGKGRGVNGFFILTPGTAVGCADVTSPLSLLTWRGKNCHASEPGTSQHVALGISGMLAVRWRVCVSCVTVSPNSVQMKVPQARYTLCCVQALRFSNVLALGCIMATLGFIQKFARLNICDCNLKQFRRSYIRLTFVSVAHV